jgi:ribonuclease HI
MKSLEIWTDGGCRMNPGIGGWGFLIPNFFNVKSYGYSSMTTNNIMEITAILEALKVVTKSTNSGQLNDYDIISARKLPL